MDPTACLNELMRALMDGDREEAIIACDNLGSWLQGGGFLPQVDCVETDQRMKLLTHERAWIVG